MSRIGRKVIEVPAGVEITRDGNVLTVKGPKGTLTREFHKDMIIKVEDNSLVVERPTDNKLHRSLHGTTRSVLSNMVEGVKLPCPSVSPTRLKSCRKRASRSMFRLLPSWSSKASAKNASAKWLLRSVLCVSRSRTRARASSTKTKSFAAKSVRPVRSNRSLLVA